MHLERASAACRLRSDKPLLDLGSSRPSSTYVLAKSVHSGGELGEDGEPVHTTVLLDINAIALFVLAVSLLVCFLLPNAFLLDWFSHDVASHCNPAFHIFHMRPYFVPPDSCHFMSLESL